MKNSIKSFLEELILNKRELSYYFIISLFIFLPNILLFINVKHLLLILVFVVVFTLLSIVSKYLFILLSSCIILLTVIFSHIYIHWGSNSISSRLQAAMLSPSYESLEYLKTYLNWIDVVILLYMFLGFFLLYWFTKLKNGFKLKMQVSFLILCLFGVLFLVKNPLIKILPFNLPYMYYEAGDWVTKAKERDSFLQKGIIIKDNKHIVPLYDNIIVVIGESASRHHMSVYGYNYNTTPFLSSLKKNKNAIFANAIAPANQTRFAIPMELTAAKADNFNHFFHAFSIVSLLKATSYKTYWISNQAKVGKYDTYVTTIADEADETYIENQNFGSSKPDSILLEYLHSLKEDTGKKQAVFIHLMGSHFQYKDRYEKEHILFEKPKNIVEEYDNSIYYTDYILDEIFHYFKSRKNRFLFVYFSDHAELVSVVKHGHGFLPPVREAYDIPLFIYSSIENPRLDIFKNRYGTKTVNLESLNNIVLYLDGLEKNISNISTRNIVSAAEPKNIFNYGKIKKFNLTGEKERKQ